jgi:hypothetical protein
MGLLRPHRAVAPAPRAPTDARGDHARTPPRILRLFGSLKKGSFFLEKSFFGVHGQRGCAGGRAQIGQCVPAL